MGLLSFHNSKLLSDAEISAFCQQIGMVVKAGLPIHYGISILRDQAIDEQTHNIFVEIYTPMEKGASLYSAIVDTGYFPPYMVQMIHLGEETGRLEEVLDSLSAYYEREKEIRAAIRHTLAYPLVMTFLMILVLSIVLTQIVPVFSQIYTKVIGELSGTALFLMNISNLLNKYSLLFVIFLVAFIVISLILYKTAFGKALFQGKGLSMSIATSRFANCMHLALASGLDVDRSLELAERLVENPFMLDKIQKCQMHIQHGESFISALTHSGIFSKIYSGLLIIGAKTGSMVDVMKKISSAYEEETDRKMRRILIVLEPALIIILSIFIGLILFAFIIPILNIII